MEHLEALEPLQVIWDFLCLNQKPQKADVIVDFTRPEGLHALPLPGGRRHLPAPVLCLIHCHNCTSQVL